jgi:hypothetical protein
MSTSNHPLHESELMDAMAQLATRPIVHADRFLYRMSKQKGAKLVTRKFKPITAARSSTDIIDGCEGFIAAREKEEQRHMAVYGAALPGTHQLHCG